MNGLPRISHHGVVRFGTLEVEAVVLDDGRRGFLNKQFAKALGYHGKNPSNRFDRFLADFAPNYMNEKGKAKSPVLNPSNSRNTGQAVFVASAAPMMTRS